MGISKDNRLRNEGMAFALKIAREGGVDGLEAELKKRGIVDMPLRLTSAKAQEFSEKVKTNVVNHILLLSLITLRDEFGFGKDRLSRFQQRFNEKADCIAGDWTTWQDQVAILAEEVGIEFEEYMKDTTVRV